MGEETVICTYRPRAECEEEFVVLLGRHWDGLSALGLVTGERSVVFRKLDEPTYVEVFTWVEGGFDRAHQTPEVLEVWKAMEPLLESRDGLPKWDFPHFKQVAVG